MNKIYRQKIIKYVEKMLKEHIYIFRNVILYICIYTSI